MAKKATGAKNKLSKTRRFIFVRKNPKKHKFWQTAFKMLIKHREKPLRNSLRTGPKN